MCTLISTSIIALTSFIRCTAFRKNLDVQAVPRKRRHTDALAECLDSKTLWDEYGIDDDIIVCAP